MRTSTYFMQGDQRVVTSDQWFDIIKKEAYSALIFDCDGTLVDSANAHFNALQSATAAQGHTMSTAFYHQRTGLDRFSILTEFAGTIRGEFNVQLACVQSIEAFVTQSMAIRAIPETVDLVRRMDADFPMSVATNSEIELARASLKFIGLLSYFHHISSVSDGLPPKPAPDIFARSAQRLGVPCSNILVFEDSDEGVRAARSAGFDVIQLL